MANVNINDDLRAFAETQAAKHGFRSVGAYVEALLLNAKQLEPLMRNAIRIEASGNGRREPRTPEAVVAAIAELDRLRVGNRLDGLSLRDLIDEGR